jgi:hypothetical protein
MIGLTAHTLLQAWERGLHQDTLERSLTLLECAFPERSRDALIDLTIGERDVCLLQLRQRTFGAAMRAIVACPTCGERLEINADVQTFMLIPPPTFSGTAAVYEFTTEACKVTFRLPTVRDLLALRACDNARALLEERCILSVQGDPVHTVRDALDKHMAQCDPQAEILFDLNCPVCSYAWNSPFDIASFLWREVEAGARRLFHEVHTLARAYSWCEADILAMSAARRQRYLEMVSHV